VQMPNAVKTYKLYSSIIFSTRSINSILNYYSISISSTQLKCERYAVFTGNRHDDIFDNLQPQTATRIELTQPTPLFSHQLQNKIN